MSRMKFELEHVPGMPVSANDILLDLRRVAECTGTNAISSRLYQQYGKYSWTTAAKRFGSWNKAVIAAGLEIANEVNVSRDRLLENLIRLWEHYGRQPRRRELAHPPSLFSEGAYRRFGSWTNALKQFVVYANSQDMRPTTAVEAARGRRTGRVRLSGCDSA